jgi:hypothetical protein
MLKKIKTRVAADNIPENLMKRLMGKAEMEMVSESAIIRKILTENLPALEDVEVFYFKALQKQRIRKEIRDEPRI